MDNLEGLYPPFRKLVEAFLFDLRSRKDNFSVGVFEGLRSFEKQAEYYAKGRTVPGKIVTWAKPGLGWHQYGCAVDIVFDRAGNKGGFQWYWPPDDDPRWAQMALIGKGIYGLEAGFYWPQKKDCPHYELSTNLTVQEALNIHTKEGLFAVWRALDKAN